MEGWRLNPSKPRPTRAERRVGLMACGGGVTGVVGESRVWQPVAWLAAAEGAAVGGDRVHGRAPMIAARHIPVTFLSRMARVVLPPFQLSTVICLLLCPSWPRC